MVESFKFPYVFHPQIQASVECNQLLWLLKLESWVEAQRDLGVLALTSLKLNPYHQPNSSKQYYALILATCNSSYAIIQLDTDQGTKF